MISENNQAGLQESQSPSGERRAARRLARFALAVLLIFFGLCGARLMALKGLLRPVRIVGGSMAETLLGEHFAITCSDCNYPFRCDAEASSQEFAVCPNCGYEQNKIDSQSAQHGERVLIDRLAFTWRSPRRGELAALHTPGDENRLTVKRIAALPGEQVAIRSGDLYINDRIHRKTFAEMRQTAILVHDNDYRPALDEETPPRWQADKSDSLWRRENHGFVRQARENQAGPKTPEFDWLTYRHWRCLLNPLPRSQESPLLDNTAYNQSVSRELHETSDLMLDCQALFLFSGNGKIVFLLHDGRDSFQWELDTGQNLVILSRNNERLASAAWSLRDGERINATIALCDQQAFFAIDGRVVLQHPYRPSGSPFQPTSRPLAIGAEALADNLSVRISRLRVYRDIYYLPPNGVAINWSLGRRLGADELFLLGDNPPISLDSRFWTEQGASEKLLVGKVLRPWGR